MTNKIAAWLQARTQREEAQGVVEYALIIGLVSIVIIGVLVTAGTGWINSITSNVTSAIG